jgi:hypothetical protein
LLLKAIRSLSEREQDVVLAYLLERSLVTRAVSEDQGGTPQLKRSGARVEYWSEIHLGASTQGPLRSLPVRFPDQQYQRLKGWSEKHDFSMAVVVRGLVERFLDEQERRAT